jgi:hypothetical protein
VYIAFNYKIALLCFSLAKRREKLVSHENRVCAKNGCKRRKDSKKQKQVFLPNPILDVLRRAQADECVMWMRTKDASIKSHKIWFPKEKSV